MGGGIPRGVQQAHTGMSEGAGREKTFCCRRWSRRAVRNARDSGGTSNQRASLRTNLHSTADHRAQLDRLLSRRAYRWELHR